MWRTLFRGRSQELTTLALACVVTLLALLVSTHVWSAPPLAAGNAPDSPQNNRRIERIPVEPLTYKAIGFERGEIRRPHGRFLLIIQNRSGVREVRFRLTSEDRQVVREFRVGPRKLDWHDAINLPEGRYTLAAADRPGRRCTIIIER